VYVTVFSIVLVTEQNVARNPFAKFAVDIEGCEPFQQFAAVVLASGRASVQ